MTAQTSRWTVFGLAIALLGIPAIVTAQHLAVSDPASDGVVVLREAAILALTAVLLWIVRSREGLPLSSIGIRPQRLWRSLAWGLGLAIVSFAAVLAVLGLYGALGVRYGEGAAIARSPAITLLTVVRAGTAEEIFYRGYAIERLQSLTGSKVLAAMIALAAFAGFHFRQGLPGVALALVLGGLITLFYLWKRDLIATMVAHFLVDFIPNVLLPLIGGGAH